MIQVTYHRKHHRVTVEGHAYSDEFGKDLVCASVSALVYTLAANVDEMATTGNALTPTICLKEGEAEIACNPKPKMKAVTMLIFDVVCTGFEMLSLRYPEYINFVARG